MEWIQCARDFVIWLLSQEWFRGAVLLSGVLVAVVSISNLRTLARRKQTADALFAGRNDEEFKLGLQCVSKIHDADNSNIRSFAKLENKDCDEFKKMLYVLNHFEFVSIGIQHGIYDEEMYRDASYGTVVSLHEKVMPFIIAMRETRKRNTIFQEFVWLADRWKSRPLKQKAAKNSRK